MTIQLGRRRFELRRGITGFLIMIAALIAFEVFNFSTTEYALSTFFGAHNALGMVSWATVLAIAFCGIDFAGLSRLFTPQAGWRKEPKEVGLLTAAWFLGSAMNAAMTWWAVASALSENPSLGNELVSREQILHTAPVFVALLVWMTRIMLIGSLTRSGDRLLVRHDGQAAVRGTAKTVNAPLPASPRGSLAGREMPVNPSLPERSAQPVHRQAPGTQTAFGAPSTLHSPPASNTRASSVRTYSPARAADDAHTAPRHYDRPQAAPAASWPASPSERRRPARDGMPIGARTVPQPAPANELVYVDLE